MLTDEYLNVECQLGCKSKPAAGKVLVGGEELFACAECLEPHQDSPRCKECGEVCHPAEDHLSHERSSPVTRDERSTCTHPQTREIKTRADRLRDLLPSLAHKGQLVLAVRATRDPQRDLEEPYALQWGAEREDAIEGVVCAYATRVAIDARGAPELLLSEEELEEELEEARYSLECYFAARGGMADDLRVVVYVARRSDRASHENEDLVTPIALLHEYVREGYVVRPRPCPVCGASCYGSCRLHGLPVEQLPERVRELRTEAVTGRPDGQTFTGRSIYLVWCKRGHADEVVPAGGQASALPSGDWTPDSPRGCLACAAEAAEAEEVRS